MTIDHITVKPDGHLAVQPWRSEHETNTRTHSDDWIRSRISRLAFANDLESGKAAVGLAGTSQAVLVFKAGHPLASKVVSNALTDALCYARLSLESYAKILYPN